MSFSDIEKQYNDDYTLWHTCLSNARPTAGESVKELFIRVVEGFKKIVLESYKDNKNGTIVIVSHGTPIRCISLYMKGLSVDNIMNIGWSAN